MRTGEPSLQAVAPMCSWPCRPSDEHALLYRKALEFRRVREEGNLAFSTTLCHLGHEDPEATANIAFVQSQENGIETCRSLVSLYNTVGAVDWGVES